MTDAETGAPDYWCNTCNRGAEACDHKLLPFECLHCGSRVRAGGICDCPVAAPIPDTTPNESADLDRIVALFERTEYVEEWPEDEREFFRNGWADGRWSDFTDRRRKLQRIRAAKVIRAVRDAALTEAEGAVKTLWLGSAAVAAIRHLREGTPNE